MRASLVTILLVGSILMAGSAHAASVTVRWCVDPTVVPLEPTGPTVGGTGAVELRMASSPYGVTVSADGRYVTDLRVDLDGLRPYPDASYVVWATTPNLDEVAKLGVVDGSGGRVEGTVAWNQFLVFVTVEPDPGVGRWTGSIVFTAMSPSGRMHTKAGHGVFEAYSYLC